jgi:hypothetical protein
MDTDTAIGRTGGGATTTATIGITGSFRAQQYHARQGFVRLGRGPDEIDFNGSFNRCSVMDRPDPTGGQRETGGNKMRMILLSAVFALGVGLAGSSAIATPAGGGFSKATNATSIVHEAYCRWNRRCWWRGGRRFCETHRRCW